MKIKFVHAYGDQETYDIQYCRPTLELDGSPEIDAVESGWVMYNGVWYQQRNSRIRVAEYPEKFKHIQHHKVIYEDPIDMTDEHYYVFKTFLKKRGFRYNYDVDTDMDRAACLSVYSEQGLVAFTKFIKYDGALESQFTAWDYGEPKLSIGRRLIDYEVEQARKMGYDYLYVGPSYGLSAIYKSKLPGFEWWTGSEWSNDADKYVEICERDASVTSLASLHRVVNEHAFASFSKETA